MSRLTVNLVFQALILILILMKHQFPHSIGEPTNYLRYIWNKTEDRALRAAVRRFKGEQWTLVADSVNRRLSSTVPPKTSKQCRERWVNQLCPTVNLGPLTKEEIAKAFEVHRKAGNRWAHIASELVRRTDNIVKNWFLCKLRKLARCVKKGTVALMLPGDGTELVQELYMVEYLHKYYLSAERHKNIARSLNSQNRRRKNGGDRYINRMVEKGDITATKLSEFVKLLLESISFEVDQNSIQKYEYLLDIAPSRSYSELDSSNPNIDLKSETIIFSTGNIILIYSLAPIVGIPKSIRIKLPLPNFSFQSFAALSRDSFEPSFDFTVYSSICLLRAEKVDSPGQCE
eukprot:TRINITY_DN7377_c0_g1_i12.p1 TRINITY_DN7377_c0_g1~~TRINITY_DN7377_c0_g1_i12.p1  ORF type:complete len:345 (+),score=31.76 TRINITY_DN7377_c0_g1_i12:181-1215(+)